jgi:hypothetical protein
MVDFLCDRIMRVLRVNTKHLLTFEHVGCCGIASARQRRVRIQMRFDAWYVDH